MTMILKLKYIIGKKYLKNYRVLYTLNAAYAQTETREAATKQRQKDQLDKQIADANAQLLVATKSVTDTIKKLQHDRAALGN
jgi:hypothetical protein